MNIIQKAQSGVKLTPSEHALLQTLLSLFLTALSTGLLLAGGLIMAPGMIDWQNLTIIVISCIVFSFAHGIAKYVATSGNPALGAAIDVLVTDVEKQIPIPVPMTSAPPPNRPTTMQLQPRFTSMVTQPDLPAIPQMPPQQRPPTQQL